MIRPNYLDDPVKGTSKMKVNANDLRSVLEGQEAWLVVGNMAVDIIDYY